MSTQSIDLDIVCQSCAGTGLYVGMAERDGVAVVCFKCKGSGKYAYHFAYEPFERRADPPADVTRVHVGRGYVLSSKHPACDGGVPVADYQPGMTVPADERLYCPWNYTTQAYCAKPDADGRAPFHLGATASTCPHWGDKATCWGVFHAEAPAAARRQIS